MHFTTIKRIILANFSFLRKTGCIHSDPESDVAQRTVISTIRDTATIIASMNPATWMAYFACLVRVTVPVFPGHLINLFVCSCTCLTCEVLLSRSLFLPDSHGEFLNTRLIKWFAANRISLPRGSCIRIHIRNTNLITRNSNIGTLYTLRYQCRKTWSSATSEPWQRLDTMIDQIYLVVMSCIGDPSQIHVI